MEDLFFELLQIAIGNRETLSVTPSAEQWAKILAVSKKQALVGIVFIGVKKLPKEQLPPVEVISQLVFSAAEIAQRNDELSVSCASLCQDLAQDGLYSCILKGQSNLANYPEDLKDYRTPGDIDVWCSFYEKNVGERGVIEWVLADWRHKGKITPKVNYHHIDWKYKGNECEIHFRPSWMNNPIHNARLQRWCKDNAQWNTCEYNGFQIPSVEFNAVYQLVHIFRHLFNEGIGLRQLLDYYFVILKFTQKCQAPLCKKQILQTIKYLNIKPFASAVMYILQKVFAMPTEYLLCAPDAKRGEFLLNEIMLAGNFGQYDSRNIISAKEGYIKRFVRRQKRFLRFVFQYPSEVIWGPYFSIKQRLWRICNGWG